MTNYSPQMIHKLHDPTISFEEYLYYAKESRAWEDSAANVAQPGLKGPKTALKNYLGQREKQREIIQGIRPDEPDVEPMAANEKSSIKKGRSKDGSVPAAVTNGVTDDEWSTAARAARTATWGAVFFLLTTDILGPFSVPFVILFPQVEKMLTFLDGPLPKLDMDLGGHYTRSLARLQASKMPKIYCDCPCANIYFGTGWQIWTMFIHLDSDRYPLKSYGDVAYRIFGPWARHCVNVLQSIQLLFIVSGVVLSSGQSIAQISKNSICYIICIFIFTIAGMLVGQVRTLRRFGWLANLAVWLNLLIMFIV